MALDHVEVSKTGRSRGDVNTQINSGRFHSDRAGTFDELSAGTFDKLSAGSFDKLSAGTFDKLSAGKFTAHRRNRGDNFPYDRTGE